MDKYVLKIYKTYQNSHFPLSKMNEGLYKLNFFHNIRFCSGDRNRTKMKVTVVGAAGKQGHSNYYLIKEHYLRQNWPIPLFDAETVPANR